MKKMEELFPPGLWLANVRFDMVVEALDGDDALQVAAAHVQRAIPDDGFHGVERAIKIDRVDDLPPEWRDSSIPWGNALGDDRSCVERLTGVPAKPPVRPSADELRARYEAGPDLYAALEQALNESGCDGDLCMHGWHDAARIALAKARGES